MYGTSKYLKLISPIPHPQVTRKANCSNQYNTNGEDEYNDHEYYHTSSSMISTTVDLAQKPFGFIKNKTSIINITY